MLVRNATNLKALSLFSSSPRIRNRRRPDRSYSRTKEKRLLLRLLDISTVNGHQLNLLYVSNSELGPWQLFSKEDLEYFKAISESISIISRIRLGKDLH